MSLLRISRNLAVLAILTVAGLSLNSRLVAAQSSCIPLGNAGCSTTNKCCAGLCYHLGGGKFGRCCLPFDNEACTTNADCCSGSCGDHRCT
jgi:hypothetical protein